MFRELFWKEWRENLWKFVFCLTTGCGFAAVLLRSRIFPDVDTCRGLLLVLSFLVPVVYGLDLFSGEYSHSTVHLLLKLPVPRWQVYAAKVLVGLLGVAVAFLGTGLFMEAWTRGRETDVGVLLRSAILCAGGAVGLLAWFMAWGCTRRSEAASLVVLVAVGIGWAIVSFWAMMCKIDWAGALSPYSLLSAAVRADVSQTWPGRLLAIQIVLWAGALGIGAFRYGQVRRAL